MRHPCVKRIVRRMANFPHKFPEHDALTEALEAHFDEYLTELKDLVSIPSIAWEAFDLAQVQRSAEAVYELAKRAGFLEVKILSASYHDETGETHQGMPAVIATKPAVSGYPTILLYAHHDVQPPGDNTQWETDPFTAVQKGARLYGRGAADDKAGVIAHMAAFRLVSDVLGNDFNVGVKIFIEGEEEAGSPSFREFLAAYQKDLAADYIVVADSANWRAGVPALTTSLRGVASGDIEVRTGNHAVHSGIFGGPFLDAHTVLARLLGTLHDDEGAVVVEGLYRGEDPKVEYPEHEFRADSGILDQMSLAGYGSITSRLWQQPALSVIGMDIPSIAHSSNTLAVTSRARISVRLAPGDSPENAHKVLADHVKKHAPYNAQVSYTPVDSGFPFATDIEQEGAQITLSAMAQAWGISPVQTGMGGSIPFIADLKENFPDAQILVTGVEDPDTRAHSANESLYVPDFKRGILAEVLILSALSRSK